MQMCEREIYGMGGSLMMRIMISQTEVGHGGSEEVGDEQAWLCRWQERRWGDGQEEADVEEPISENVDDMENTRSCYRFPNFLFRLI